MFAAILLVLLFVRTLSVSIDKANTNATSFTSSKGDGTVFKTDDALDEDAEALSSCERADGRCHPCPQYPRHIHHICHAHKSHDPPLEQPASGVKDDRTHSEAHSGHKSVINKSHESQETAFHDSVGQDAAPTHNTARLQSSEHKSSPSDTSDAYSIDTATNKSNNSTPPSTPSPGLPKSCMINKLSVAMHPVFRPATFSSCDGKYRQHIDDTESPVKGSIIELADMERDPSEQQTMDQDEELQDILDRFSKMTIGALVLYSSTAAASGPLPPPTDLPPISSPPPVLSQVPEPVEPADVAPESSLSPVLIPAPAPVEPGDAAQESAPSPILSTVPETIEPVDVAQESSPSRFISPVRETAELADLAADSSPSPVFIPINETAEPAEAAPEFSQSPTFISDPETMKPVEVLNQIDEVAVERALSALSELAISPKTREQTQHIEDVVFKDAPAVFAPVDEYDPNRPQMDLTQDPNRQRSATLRSTRGSQSSSTARGLFAAAFPAGYETIPTSHVGELCGLNAIIKSIEANFPSLPLPTLEVLLEVLYSTEFTQWQQAGFLLDNSKNLYLDQVGAVLHFWAARHLDLNLQLGIKIEGKEPYLIPYGSDSQHDRHVVWIYNDNAEEEFRGFVELAVLNHFSGMKPKDFPVHDTEMVKTEYKSMEDNQDTEAVTGLNDLLGMEPLGVPVGDTEMVSTEDKQHGEASMEDDQDTRASPRFNDFPVMVLPDIVFNDAETVTAEEAAELEAFMADDQYTDIGPFLDQLASTKSAGLQLGDAEMISTEDIQQVQAPMEDDQDRPEVLGRPDSFMDDEIHPEATFDSYQSQRPSSPESSALSGQLRSSPPQLLSANISDTVMDDGYRFEPHAGSYVPPEPSNPALRAIFANLGWNIRGTATNDRPHISTNDDIRHESAIESDKSLATIDPQLLTESANVGYTIPDTATSDRPYAFTNDEVRHESAVESETSLATIDPRLFRESANLRNTDSATPPADASQTSMLNGSPNSQKAVCTDLQSVLQRLDPAAAADLVASLNSTRRRAERVIMQPRSVLSRGRARMPSIVPSIFPSNAAVDTPPPEVANGFVAGQQQQSNSFDLSSSVEAGRIRFGGTQQQPQSSMLTPPDSPDNLASRPPDQPSKPVTKGPKPTAKDRARAAGIALKTLLTDNVPIFDVVSPATASAQPATTQTRAASTPSTESENTPVLDGSTGNDFHAAPAMFVPTATTTNHLECPTEEEIYNAIHPRMGRRQVDLTLVIFKDRVNAHNRRLFRQRVKKVSWYTPCEQDPNEIILYRDLEWKQAQVSSLPPAAKAPPAQTAPQQQMIPGLSLLGGEEEVVGDIADDEILMAKRAEDEQIARLLASRMEKDPEAYEYSDSEGSESDIFWENVYPDDGLEGQFARPKKRQGRGDDDDEEGGEGGGGEMGGGRRKRSR